MPKKLHLDVEIVKQLYIEQGKTASEVGAIIGCSQPSVLRCLKKHDLHARKSWESRQLSEKPLSFWNQRHDINGGQMVALYQQGLSIHALAQKFSCDRTVVKRRLGKAGQVLRSVHETMKLRPKKTGPQNGNWKGGRFLDVGGYVKVLNHGHPRANCNGYVCEHILIWEEAHNKYLPKGWVIHHLNGVRADNRPSNLRAMPRRKHANILEPYRSKIRELEAENKQLRQALESGQMLFTFGEN